MLLLATLVGAALLSVAPAEGPAHIPPPPPAGGAAAQADTAEDEGGAGVSPVELIPRLELRQTFTKLEGGVSVHDSTLEVDIQFLRRLLLRYQVPARLLETPMGQVSGIGDLQVGLIAILASNARAVVALIASTILDTATQPALGAGKQQLEFGLGAAFKPYRRWLAYGVTQDQFSVGGDASRPDINQLSADFGSIVFGHQYNWLKLDVNTTVDFESNSGARVYGLGEVGSLVIGRVGLFARAGTQLLGARLVDYTMVVGVRYLFRLESRDPGPTERRRPAAPARGCGGGWCRRRPARASCGRRSPPRAGGR